MFFSFSQFELLEYRFTSSGPDLFVWDFGGWYGGDYHRLWVKTEGELELSGVNQGEGELQLLYSRLISPYWDFQVGARAKQNLGRGFADNSRTYAVIGLEGLSPFMFEVEPAIYISDRGEVSAELTASFDVRLAQRLVLQPRVDADVTVQGDKRFGTGRGGTGIDLGARLRYNIAREIAPYVGVSWERSFGANARIARDEGESPGKVSLVTGFQLWW